MDVDHWLSEKAADVRFQVSTVPFALSFLHDSQDLPVLESTDEREAASAKCCLHLSLRFEKVSEVVC